MGFDLDPLDDILPEPAAVNARAGGKFQPKAKARLRKVTSVSVPSTASNATKEKIITSAAAGSGTTQSVQPVDLVDNGLNDAVGPSLAASVISTTKDPLRDNKHSFGAVPLSDNNRSLALENPFSQLVVPREDVGTLGPPSSEAEAPHSEVVSDNNGDWHSSFRKLDEETISMGSKLEAFEDILPEHATDNACASSNFQSKVEHQPRRGTVASVSSLPLNARNTNSCTSDSTGPDKNQCVQPIDVENKGSENLAGLLSTTHEIIGSIEMLKNDEGSPSGLELHHENRSFLVNSSSQLVLEGLRCTDALHSEVAGSDDNVDWVSSFGKSVGEADSMGFDLDPFDDIPGPATSNVRAGGKFKPMVRPRSRKEKSASVSSTLPDITKEKAVTLAATCTDAKLCVQPSDLVDNRLADLVDPSLTTSRMLEIKKPLVSGVTLSEDDRSSELVNPLAQLDVIDSLHSEVAISDGNSSWHSSYGKSSGQNADIFSELEYFEGFPSQLAAVTVSTESKLQAQVNMNALPGNKFQTSYPVYSDTEGCLSPSDTQNLPDSNHKDIEKEPEGPVIGREADVCDNEDFHIDDGRLQSEEVEAFPGLETPDILSKATLASGQHTGQDLSQPKLHTYKDKPSFDAPYLDAAQSVSCSQDAHLLPSETEYMVEGSIPAFPPDEVLDFSSVRFSNSAPIDPTYEPPSSNEPTGLAENGNLGDAATGVHSAGSVPKISGSESSRGRKRKTSTVSNLSEECQKSLTAADANEIGKSSRRLRKQIVRHELVDESDDEPHDSGGQPAETLVNSVAYKEGNSDDEYKVENSPRKKRAARKSKKSTSENEKPVQKRKKANETEGKLTKEPPKRFSHSTRRKRRCVDKVLLETPEDEIDNQRVPIRDLIILAEMRERMNKEATSLKTPLANQSTDDSYLEDTVGNEWGTSATEQIGASNDDEENIGVQSGVLYTNYQSFMDKTPIARWSKSETELFYQAVQQFGTDFSMILQLFPGRTRNQVKLKYKKEERKHPSRLFDASSNRAKDHSHFELLIEQLQRAAAQAGENLKQEDTVGLTGVEEGAEEGATKADQNEEAAMEEAVAEEDDTGVGEVGGPEKFTDVVEVRGPDESEEDDELYRWSQYKSEF